MKSVEKYGIFKTDYITYTYTTSSGCTESATGSIVLTSPITITSALNNVCPGQTNTLTATGCSNCVWTPSSVTCQNSSCSVVTTTQSATTTYSVYDASNTSCTASITVNEFNPVILSNFGNNTCTNSYLNLTTTPALPGYSYTWYSLANSVSTAVGTGYLFSFQNPVAGSYQMYVTINNGVCSASSPVQTYTVSAPPTATLSSSSVTGCYPNCPQVTASVTPSGTYYYNWYQNNVFVPNATSSTFSSCNSGNYTLIVTDPVTLCASTPVPFTSSISNISVSAVANGPTTVCSTSSVPLSALPSNNPGWTYQWYNNNVPVPNGTSATLSATASGLYTVQATDGNGCVGISNGIQVTIYPAPTATITPSGNITNCQSQTFSVTISPLGGNYNYQWQQNGSSISNATGSSYTAGSNGTYSVAVVNTVDNCQFSSNTANLTIAPTPTPTITSSGTLCDNGSIVLTCTNPTSGYTYQWKLNGANAPGGNTSTYTVSGSNTGTYTLVITSTSNSACTATSAPITISPATTIGVSISASSTTVCQNNSVTLTAVTVPTTISGVTYQWYLNGAAIPSATASTYTTTNAGTYTVKVSSSNPLSGLCSHTSSGTTITSDNSECSPCTIFNGQAFTPLSGTLSSGSYTGNVYISGDLTINGTVNFTNAYVFIATGKKITLNNNGSFIGGATLNISGSHLFPCQNWVGIIMTGNGTVNVTNNSLIELAGTAISSTNYNKINCNNAIFNIGQKNTGIHITNYTGPISDVTINGSVFTNSAFSGTYSSWPSAATLTAVPSPAPSLFTVPYYLTTNVAAQQNPAAYGINLSNAGSLNIGSTTTANVPNLFYNCQYGIYSTNTSLNIQNSSFAGYIPNGGSNSSTIDGIYAGVGSPGYTFSMPLTAYSCSFYYCNRSCVEAANYQNFTGQGATMVGNNPATSDPNNPGGNYGYNVTTYQYSILSLGGGPTNVSNTVISNNLITDICTGIYAKFTGYGFPAANGSIYGNTIQVDPALQNNQAAAASSSRAVNFAIMAIYSPLAGSFSQPGLLSIYNNPIYDAYEGIIASGFSATHINTYNNQYVRMRHTSGSAQQMGISYYNCRYGTMYNNLVFTPVTNPLFDNMRAICLGGTCNNSLVSCNNVQNIGRGFMFDGSIPMAPINWYPGNKMTNCSKGVHIYNSLIGQQGTPSSPMDNSWLGSWNGPNYQTYMDHTPPFVNSNNTQNINNVNQGKFISYVTLLPTANNAGNPGGFNYVYSMANGTLVPCGGSGCTPVTSCPINNNGGGHLNSVAISEMEQVASDLVEYDQNTNIDRWMAQYGLYQALQGNAIFNDDSTITYEYPTDSSNILNIYYNLAQNSRFAYLTNIEQDIATGDITDAQNLLANPWSSYEAEDASGAMVTDVSDADYIVANYIKYYNIHINYLDSTMTSSDSSYLTTLAWMCPATNGEIVYKARTLYDVVFDTIVMWNDDSLCSIPTGRLLNIGTIQKVTTQHYTLNPNPNNGSMFISQAVTDDNPVLAEVWNEQGQLMYSNTLIFNQRNARVEISKAVPGLYFLQLRDSSGKSYALKFVVH